MKMTSLVLCFGLVLSSAFAGADGDAVRKKVLISFAKCDGDNQAILSWFEDKEIPRKISLSEGDVLKGKKEISVHTDWDENEENKLNAIVSYNFNYDENYGMIEVSLTNPRDGNSSFIPSVLLSSDLSKGRTQAISGECNSDLPKERDYSLNVVIMDAD